MDLLLEQTGSESQGLPKQDPVGGSNAETIVSPRGIANPLV